MTYDRPITVTRRPQRSASPIRWLLAALGAWRQRQQLSELPDHLLRDIGVTSEQARKESEQPIWNVPAHWLR